MVNKKTKASEPSAPPEENGRQEGIPWNEELLTTRELMEFLNLSRTKIWELVTKEGLPAFKIGGDYRYRRSEVLVWLEKYRVKR
jgi:excisionase family DNA binding protein